MSKEQMIKNVLRTNDNKEVETMNNNEIVRSKEAYLEASGLYGWLPYRSAKARYCSKKINKSCNGCKFHTTIDDEYDCLLDKAYYKEPNKIKEITNNKLCKEDSVVKYEQYYEVSRQDLEDFFACRSGSVHPTSIRGIKIG